MILAGRRINDGMGAYIAQQLVKLLIAQDVAGRRARVGVLGLTFKENVPDLRNSRVPDIVRELASSASRPTSTTRWPTGEAARREYGLALTPLDVLRDWTRWSWRCRIAPISSSARPTSAPCSAPAGILIDVKSALDPDRLLASHGYWSL